MESNENVQFIMKKIRNETQHHLKIEKIDLSDSGRALGNSEHPGREKHRNATFVRGGRSHEAPRKGDWRPAKRLENGVACTRRTD